jgi:hypothetical protein
MLPPLAADALDDEVLANTPRPPTRADICAILTGALDGTGCGPAATRPGRHPARRPGTGREMINPLGPVIPSGLQAGGTVGLKTDPMRADSMRSHR